MRSVGGVAFFQRRMVCEVDGQLGTLPKLFHLLFVVVFLRLPRATPLPCRGLLSLVGVVAPFLGGMSVHLRAAFGFLRLVLVLCCLHLSSCLCP